MQALAVIEAKQLEWAPGPRAELVDAWLSGRAATTVAAYRRDLLAFAAFLEVDPGQAVGALLSEGPGRANHLALRYRASMLERGLSPATINRRLAALRSLVKVARTIGMVGWTMDVENVRSESYRDTRGPGVEGYRGLLDELRGRKDAKGARDRAILHLLFDLGLRRAEVVSLDREHLEGGSLSVMGKGRRERVSLTLPAPTSAALDSWLAFRGEEPGPLFTSIDKGGTLGDRLTGGGLHLVVQTLGRKVGLHVWPHGLRHAAITCGLDRTGGDVRAVAKFSRHADIRVLTFYDDSRVDMAGRVAALIAG